MPASAQTAMAAFKVVFFCENNIPVLIFVKIVRIEIGVAEYLCYHTQIY